MKPANGRFIQRARRSIRNGCRIALSLCVCVEKFDLWPLRVPIAIRERRLITRLTFLPFNAHSVRARVHSSSETLNARTGDRTLRGVSLVGDVILRGGRRKRSEITVSPTIMIIRRLAINISKYPAS